MAMTEIEFNKLNEAVGILMGWRPVKGDKPGMATTRAELAKVQDIVKRLNGSVADLTSAQVTAAPTAADFNKLQADVAAIHDLLSGLISSNAS